MGLTTDLKTKRVLAALFAAHTSARILIGGAAVMLVVRLAVAVWFETARLSPADGMSALIGVAMIGVVEWFAHRVLFHAPETSRRSRFLKTGHSHRRHHDDPTDLAWVLLHARGAGVLMIAVVILVAAWAVPVALIARTWPIGPWLTATVVGWLAIANYEWTHLLLHSAYRPRSKRYRRLVRNHRLHHYRDEHNWFGVTTNSGDRLLGTLPSPTVRHTASR